MAIFWISYGVALCLAVLIVLLRNRDGGISRWAAVVSTAGIGIGLLAIFLLWVKVTYWMALIPLLLVAAAMMAESSWAMILNVLCVVWAAAALAAGARALLPRATAPPPLPSLSGPTTGLGWRSGRA